MKTAELFKQKTVLSFEVFPPKPTMPVETIYDALEAMRDLAPDYISVTYGAGGSENAAKTVEIAAAIKQRYQIEGVAHLPCINLSKPEVRSLLDDFRAAGIENILALRGDRSPDRVPKTDFQYASDLIAFIKAHGDFNILGACYPEGHIECEGLLEDIRNLKTKVDAGVNQLVTQLFFCNEYFYAFRERAAMAGIHVPISVGIMPVTSKNQITRMVTLCGAHLSGELEKILERYADDPVSLRAAGIDYAIRQIQDLIDQEVDGIHLYTMNNADTATQICRAVSATTPV